MSFSSSLMATPIRLVPGSRARTRISLPSKLLVSGGRSSQEAPKWRMKQSEKLPSLPLACNGLTLACDECGAFTELGCGCFGRSAPGSNPDWECGRGNSWRAGNHAGFRFHVSCHHRQSWETQKVGPAP